jgi:hypothetical protein
MKHGYKLRLLFLDSVSFPNRWSCYPDTLLTLCPQLRHLSIDVPKLGRLLDVRHVNLGTIQLGDSQAVLSTDATISEVHFRIIGSVAAEMVRAMMSEGEGLSSRSFARIHTMVLTFHTL